MAPAAAGLAGSGCCSLAADCVHACTGRQLACRRWRSASSLDSFASSCCWQEASGGAAAVACASGGAASSKGAPCRHLKGRRRGERPWRARVVPGYRGRQKAPPRRTVPPGGSEMLLTVAAVASGGLTWGLLEAQPIVPASFLRTNGGGLARGGVCLRPERRWQLSGTLQGCHSAGGRLEPPHTPPRAPLRTSARVLPVEMYFRHRKRVAERSKMQEGAAVPHGRPSKVAQRRSMHGRPSRHARAKIATSLCFESP